MSWLFIAEALPNNLALSNAKYFLICFKVWSLHSAVRHEFSICFIKFRNLSIVILSKCTPSDSLISINPVFRLYLNWSFSRKIINWNVPGFVLSDLILNQWRVFFIFCAEAYSGFYQASKKEYFAKIVNSYMARCVS